MKTFLCLILFFFINQDSAKDWKILPQYGMRLKIPNEGLKFISGYIEESLKKLQDTILPFPDKNIDFAGGYLRLNRATVISIGKIGVLLGTVKRYGFKMQISIDFLTVKGYYEYYVLGFFSSGIIEAKFDDIKLNVTIEMSHQKTNLDFLGCEIDGKISLELDEMFDNSIIKMFKTPITKTIFNGICEVIENKFEKTSPLKSLSFFRSVEFNNMIFNFSLSDDMWFLNNTIEIFLSGNIHAKGYTSSIINDYATSYFEKSSNDIDKVVYLYISNYTVTQFAEAAHVSGYLNVNLNEEAFPAPIKIIMQMLPILIRELPKSGKPVINMKSSRLPRVIIENDLLRLDISCTVSLWYKTTSDLIHIGTYNLAISIKTEISFENDYLKFKIHNLESIFLTEKTMSISFSETLEKAMKFIDPVIMPVLNVWGKRGLHINLPLPKEISLKNALIKLRKNAIVFSTDLEIDEILLTKFLID